MPCDKWKCCKIISYKNISLKDKKSPNVFILINQLKRNIGKIKLDECDDYKNIGQRCDFVINCPDKNITIFIELKGKNLKKALSQLKNSIYKLKKYSCNTIYAFCILTRTPRTTAEIQNIKKDFRKDNIFFDSKNREMKKDLEKLF